MEKMFMNVNNKKCSCQVSYSGFSVPTCKDLNVNKIFFCFFVLWKDMMWSVEKARRFGAKADRSRTHQWAETKWAAAGRWPSVQRKGSASSDEAKRESTKNNNNLERWKREDSSWLQKNDEKIQKPWFLFVFFFVYFSVFFICELAFGKNKPPCCRQSS